MNKHFYDPHEKWEWERTCATRAEFLELLELAGLTPAPARLAERDIGRLAAFVTDPEIDM